MRNDNNKAYIRGVGYEIKMSLSEIIKCIAKSPIESTNWSKSIWEKKKKRHMCVKFKQHNQLLYI